MNFKLTDQRRLTVIATILPAFIASNVLVLERERPAVTGDSMHYLASIWNGLLRATDDASFWAVISCGVVGVFILKCRTEIGEVSADYSLAERTSESASWASKIPLTLISMSGIVLSRDLWKIGETADGVTRTAYALDALLGLLAVACAATFLATGEACVNGLVRQLDATQEPAPAATGIGGRGFLSSALIAGPLMSIAAFALWKCVNAFGSPTPPNPLGLGQEVIAGVMLIAIVSLPSVALHLAIRRRLRGRLAFRPRWANLFAYFLSASFVGIPLRLSLIRATHLPMRK